MHTSPTPERYFFIHLEKTGGTSFSRMLDPRFAPDERYPGPTDLPHLQRPYPDLTPHICTLIGCPTTRLQRIRLLRGHFPYIAGTLLPEPPRCLVFLRHPVARTLSHLRHAKRYVPALQALPLDEILETAQGRRALLHNPLTKAFSFQSVAEACLHQNEVRVDEARLAQARQNLQACAFIGITEAFDTSIRLCEHIFGWQLGPALHLNRNQVPMPIPPTLAERILPYVQYDLALYAEACRLHRHLLDHHRIT